ncbi:MAG: YbhB/YbcL family Raf kinase inhibitor-like protein, partial [Bdellovibrionota bacterium]
MPFQLRSIDFNSGQIIPERFSAQELGVNPALTWCQGPREAVEYALICEDPDAPLPKPFVHWILYGLAPDLHFIPDRLPKQPELREPIRARQGLNSLMEPGFTGPNPPFWDGVHRYVFRLFALKVPLNLPPGAGRQ